jgi:hypothetical protein
MKTFIGFGGESLPGGNFRSCAGGCGAVQEFPESFGDAPFWCEPCIDREAARAAAQMRLLPEVAPTPAAPVAAPADRPPLPRAAAAAARAGGTPVGEAELDADLAKTVKRTALMRQAFYVVVLGVALAGQVSGAVEALGIPIAAAIPAVGALELGGVVVLANADVRRRLGERAIASRLLSAAIAAGAVAFNWFAHADHLLGGFFAGMSALGYLVWLMHTENQRRDRLRAKGDLPPTTPAYELVGHWLRHPWLTRRARSIAKTNPKLGLYGSVAAARAQVRQERRQKAIAKVLRRKVRAAVDPTMADIAVAVYDLDQIAARLAAGADYDGLTALLAVDLTPARIAAGEPAGPRALEPGEPVDARTGEPTHPVRGAHHGGEPERGLAQSGPGEPAHGGVGEPAQVAIGASGGEPAHDGSGGARRTRTAPAQQRRTDRVTVPVQGDAESRLSDAYAALCESLGREPSGPELGERAGVSRATANRWKAAHRRTGGES